MAWHVKIAKLPWCRTIYANRKDLRIVAHDDNVALMCSHTEIAHAVAMVEWLRAYGVNCAKLVEGMCEEARVECASAEGAIDERELAGARSCYLAKRDL